MMKRIGILILYCLPAMVAVGYSLWANYDRALSVASKLENLLDRVGSDDDLLQDLAKGDDGNEIAQVLLSYLRLHEKMQAHSREEAPAAEATAAADAGTSEEGTPEDGAPEDGAPEDGTAEDETPEVTLDATTFNEDDVVKAGAELLEEEAKRGLGDFFLHMVFHSRPNRSFIQERLEGIWWRQTLIISTMTLLPFLLLGSALAFDRHGERDARDPLGVTLQEKVRIARERWALKLLFSGVVMMGWTYVVNPIGRGATLAYSFAQTSNLLSANTLPLFVDSRNLISPTACGFLGWYLLMLSYFFKKLYQHDTMSSRVYGLLFRQFLFVYGISLMITVLASDQAKIVAFLIGFFPLSAVKTVKDFALKAAQKDQEKREASLMDLPCISHWQALRLEEEGIEDIPGLASVEPWRLRARLPIKPEVVDLWIDAARLVSIVGVERYKKLEKICQTATHFEIRSGDDAFRKQIEEDCGIGNPDEIVSLLRATFSPISQDATAIVS